MQIIKTIINLATTVKSANFHAYRRTKLLFFILGFIFIYFKVYKYNRYLEVFGRKIEDTPFQIKKLGLIGSIYEHIILFPEDLFLTFYISLGAYLIFSIRKKILYNIIKTAFLIFGILIISLLLIDSQIYKLFNVHVNTELISIAFNWPLTLLQGKTLKETHYRIIRYSILLTCLLIVFIYVLYNRRILKKPEKEFKTKYPVIVFIALFGLTFLPKLRPIDGLENNILIELMKENIALITENTSSEENKKAFKYLHQYRIKTGNYIKRTGLKPLALGKTNVILVLLESTSYKYYQTPKYSKTVFPFLSKFIESSDAIHVDKYYATVPHSSVSRATMMTGNYNRPDRYFRRNEKYTGESLVSVLNRAGYKSYYLHTCDLKFENQRPYFKKMGLRVLDGKWMKAAFNKPQPYFGWGFNDINLVDVGMKEVLRETREKYGADEDKPFLVFFSYIGPHQPYFTPKDFINPKLNKVTAKRSKSFKRYIRALNYQDFITKKLFNLLEKENLLNDTLFIILGDHGESFREHGYKFHNVSLFNEEIRVPFFMVHPDFKKSKIRKLNAGSHVDIFPTVMDIFGHNLKIKVHGKSLFKRDRKKKIYLNSFASGITSALVHKNKKYIYHRISDTLLKYNLLKDPNELSPVRLDKEKNVKIINELNTSRVEIIKSHNINNTYITK
jgi:phosphoglycerol transferase MdoB-like AlkP superfamily enzyme